MALISADQSIRWKERIGIIGIGHTAKKVEEYLFDWLLYGSVSAFAVAHLGWMWGAVATFAIMVPFSIAMCLLYFRLYDWAKVDWFGFEAIKEMRDELSGTSRVARYAHRIARFGDVPAFFAFSLFFDPFMTTLYLRKGAGKYNGMSERDWRVFWASVVVSNGYWSLRWSVIIEALQFLWPSFKPFLQGLGLN